MAKQVIALVLIAVLVSTATGFALGAASNPQRAGAATSSEVVTQLKRLNNKVKTLNVQIGEQQQSKGSVRGLLTIICDYTASIDCKQP
jgi:peptidoglycan hydrolase CwlO-like protein